MNKKFGAWLACVLLVIASFLFVGYHLISPSFTELAVNIGNLLPGKDVDPPTEPQVYISFGSDEGLSDNQWRAHATCRNGEIEYKCTAEWSMFPTNAASIDRKSGVITIHSVDKFEICAHVDGEKYSRCGAAMLPKVNRSNRKQKQGPPIG